MLCNNRTKRGIYILKLVYINSKLLHVSASHVTIFRDTKYKGKKLNAPNFVFYIAEVGRMSDQNI